MMELPALEDFEKSYRAILEGNLKQYAERLPGRSAAIAVHPARTHGHGIAEYCRSIGADLVIMGAKGQTNLKYVLLGSTVERLLKEIPCSVLVVRPGERPPLKAVSVLQQEDTSAGPKCLFQSSN